MNQETSNAFVKKCLIEIEQKLDLGDSQSWHSSVFTELSNKIYQSTGVLLSDTTLKRVWGRLPYKSAPSITTLNALVQFIDYDNWQSFKSSNSSKKRRRKIYLEFSKTKNKTVLFGLASGIALLFIALFSVLQSLPNTNLSNKLSDIKFTSRPIASGVPNSVVFDFDLKSIDSDSIYIQQFWDPTKTIEIEKNQKQATGIYYFPGFFRAKLIIDGLLIKEHELFIRSNGWVGTIDFDPIPKYINSSSFENNGMRFKREILDEIKSHDTPLFSTFHLVSDNINISGDNFTLETEFENIYRDKWAVCQTTKIVVLGTKGAMIIPFSIPGCVSDLNLFLNTVSVEGKTNDLSAFGHDFSYARNVRVKVVDMHINIEIDGVTIYENIFSDSIGNIVGLRYRFLGAGQVNSLKLTSEDGLDIINKVFFN